MDRNRNILLHSFLLSGCLWAVAVQFFYRIPVNFLPVLMPLVSIMACSMSAVFLVTHGMGRTPVEGPFRRIFEYLDRWSSLFVAVFCFYSLFVFTNARYDRSRPISYSTEVVGVRAGRLNLGGSIPYAWAELRSWQTPNQTESILLHFDEQENLWPGQAVLVEVRDGYFYIPWVVKITPDEEKRLLSIVKSIPAASRAWRDLTDFYVKLNRWPDAEKSAVEYLKLYPFDSKFALQHTPSFFAVRLFKEVVSILEPVAAHKFDYELYLQLGFALALSGEKADGLRFIHKAVEKEPDNYRGYYILGKTHLRTGDPAAAIPPYEKALRLRPDYPEVEDDLRQMRSLAADQRINKK